MISFFCHRNKKQVWWSFKKPLMLEIEMQLTACKKISMRVSSVIKVPEKTGKIFLSRHNFYTCAQVSDSLINPILHMKFGEP